MGMAMAIHFLLLLWNPTMLSSSLKATHEFVTIDLVDQSAGGSAGVAEPKKQGMFESLKDLLSKPKVEEIAHQSPEPVVPRVAAPIQPALQERTMPRPISRTFVPNAQTEDIASASTPNQIQTNTPKVNVPIGGPTLTSKNFGGIRSKDLPFAVGGDDGLSSNSPVVPIAVGNQSSKRVLQYGGASLADKTKRPGIASSSLGGGQGQLDTIGGGASQNIAISGTGGTGNAPTGAMSGSVLQDRAGSGSGSGRGRGFGSGSGSGSGFGVGSVGIPSAAQRLDEQLGASGSGPGKTSKGSKRDFEISGPMSNRPIAFKVIPQYPAWAEEQGIIGSVRLYFTVTPEGNVRPNIRVTKTTGYPQLDQLGIDALKQWKFAPLNSADEGKGEWGILTFNFSLSS